MNFVGFRTSRNQRQPTTTHRSSAEGVLLLLLPLLCGVLGPMATTVDGLSVSSATTTTYLLPRAVASLLTPDGRKRESLKAELFRLVKRSSPPGNPAGAFDDDADGERFDEIFFRDLPALNPTKDPARSPLFSGEWECVWTSEKEINFLVGSGLFGDGWTRTYQVIDVPGNRLENNIVFANDGVLRVGSSIKPDPEEGSRFNIRFNEANLRWKGRLNLSLPPVGSGWGELLYLDEDIRLQRDIRGDRIVARRVR